MRSIAHSNERRAKVGAALGRYLAHEERRTRSNAAERARIAAALRPVRERIVTVYGRRDPFAVEGRRA